MIKARLLPFVFLSLSLHLGAFFSYSEDPKRIKKGQGTNYQVSLRFVLSISDKEQNKASPTHHAKHTTLVGKKSNHFPKNLKEKRPTERKNQRKETKNSDKNRERMGHQEIESSTSPSKGLLPKSKGGSLSSESTSARGPQLVPNTFKIPQYTEAAIQAGIEGVFTLRVKVGKSSKALEVKIFPPIGYGMDAQVKKAFGKARFLAARDAFGRQHVAWYQTSLYLQLE